MKTLALTAAAFLFASGARAEMDEHAAKAVEHLKSAQEALKQSPVMGHAHGDFKKADLQIKAAIKNVEGGVKLYDRDQAKKAGKKGKSGSAAMPPAETPPAGAPATPPAGAPATPPAGAPATPPAGAGSGS